MYSIWYALFHRQGSADAVAAMGHLITKAGKINTPFPHWLTQLDPFTAERS